MSQNVECPSCNEDIPANAKFCRFCGHNIVAKPPGCPGCGEPVEEGDRFCRHCGTETGKVEAAAEAPEAVEEAEEAPEVEEEEEEEVAPAPPAPRKKKKKKKRPEGTEAPVRRMSSSREARPRRRRRREQNPNRTAYIIAGALVIAAVIIALVVQDNNNRPEPGPGPGTPPGHEHAQGGMGGGGGGGAPPATVQGSDGSGPMDISGVITLSEKFLQAAPAARAIYIIARPPGMTTGMPIAAVKLPASRKPIPYAIGPADVMNADIPFNGPVELSARWDQDGEASSKSPTDITGGPEKNPVSPGTKGVDIILDTPLGSPGAVDKTKPEEAAVSQPADASKAITGTISLDESVKASAPKVGFFFIIARPAGVQGGPPLAVHKIPASAEPTAFRLGPEHRMGEGDFNQPLTLTVRWDQDGSSAAQTGDLKGKAASDPVKAGDKDVKVLLNVVH